MAYSFSYEPNRLIAHVTGEIDMAMTKAWRQDLERELLRKPARQLTFDFSEVTFIDSSGLGVILGRYRQISARGGKVQISGASRNVAKLLRLSGFGRIMEIYEADAETNSDSTNQKEVEHSEHNTAQ